MGSMEWIVALAVGLALGAVIGFLRGKGQLAGAVPLEKHNELANDKAALAAKFEMLQARTDELNDAVEHLKAQADELKQQVATNLAEKQALTKNLEDIQQQNREQFQNTANGILEAVTKKFTDQSEKKIGELLEPMKNRLNDFQELVVKSFGEEGKERHTLKSEIEKIVLQTDSLTKALRGDVKAQGNWGEVMLEKILEEAGLRKDRDYTAQGSEMGLTGADGNRLKPDILVNLPDNKHIIIDSKVSLTAYERFCGEPDDTAQALHLREFLKSVRAHINGLSAKSYQDIGKLDTLDFVFLFMPIEGAYSLAVQQDPELQAYAWSKRIALVCPTTLFASLRVVSYLWRIERQNKNAEEISKRGGLLYDKFVGFVDDMNRIGNQLGSAQKTYNDAMSKLAHGTGHLVGQAEKLKKMGVKTSKSLPRELIGVEVDDVPQLEVAE